MPAVEINGVFYSFKDALALRGAELKKTSDYYLVEKGPDRYVIKNDEMGLSKVSLSFWPHNILTNFVFSETIGFAKVFINGSGPIPNLETDKYGRGKGSAYVDSSLPDPKIVLRNQVRNIEGTFVFTKEEIKCTGKKKLICK